MSIAFQFCKVKKNSGDWLHNNVDVLNTTELYFNMFKIVNFILCVIPHSF